MRQVLDTHFPLEGDALAADTHRAAGWQPACGRGWCRWARMGQTRR
jgi:hypothetical protein